MIDGLGYVAVVSRGDLLNILLLWHIIDTVFVVKCGISIASIILQGHHEQQSVLPAPKSNENTGNA